MEYGHSTRDSHTFTVPASRAGGISLDQGQGIGIIGIGRYIALAVFVKLRHDFVHTCRAIWFMALND